MKHIPFSIATLILCISVLSCSENNMAEIENLTSADELPLITMKDADINFTDSALVKAKIHANLVETYVYYDKEGKNVEDQKLVMTGDILARFYDALGDENSRLTANKATRMDKSRITEIEQNVVVVNTNNDSLSTEFLIWDEGKNRIYTEKQVRVKTATEIIFAEGFESDVNFTEYTFTNVIGEITLNKD